MKTETKTPEQVFAEWIAPFVDDDEALDKPSKSEPVEEQLDLFNQN